MTSAALALTPGTRVRIIGGPLWSTWKRPLIGITGRIEEPPAVLLSHPVHGTLAVSPGLLWFRPDPDRETAVVGCTFVRAEELEVIEVPA
ncbi:hypothetical protein [Methylobacterium nodulans]|uniref:Uncharacterized protein n=1 Tax=Methylobacterium nodulans (strain LMG 21967 / CNCM I-2342 / ORS 2060) TaxID=460265 RepID=B8ICS4_METNO|nr:hypothetical protein [Methylobacterium nodulans]ACL57485.1 hypothetical protein Mnod_2515 [Methylobacterium nodulans ORS 2060]